MIGLIIDEPIEGADSSPEKRVRITKPIE